MISFWLSHSFYRVTYLKHKVGHVIPLFKIADPLFEGGSPISLYGLQDSVLQCLPPFLPSNKLSFPLGFWQWPTFSAWNKRWYFMPLWLCLPFSLAFLENSCPSLKTLARHLLFEAFSDSLDRVYHISFCFAYCFHCVFSSGPCEIIEGRELNPLVWAPTAWGGLGLR